MKLKEIREILDAEPLVVIDEKLEVKKVCGSDLLSDVLAFSQKKSMLLTGLTNPQVIRTADMIELQVIVFVRGKSPQSATVNMARENGISLYITGKSMFESCGLLYQHGLQPEQLEEIG
ncbi:MAG: hypothetical protein ACOCQC_00780 [Halanaerobiaceae bacterium]